MVMGNVKFFGGWYLKKYRFCCWRIVKFSGGTGVGILLDVKMDDMGLSPTKEGHV